VPHVIDNQVEAGKTYFYYLEDIDLGGVKTKSEIIQFPDVSLAVSPKGKLATTWGK